MRGVENNDDMVAALAAVLESEPGRPTDGVHMDVIWRMIEAAGGSLPVHRVSSMRPGVDLGVSLCIFTEADGHLTLLI